MPVSARGVLAVDAAAQFSHPCPRALLSTLADKSIDLSPSGRRLPRCQTLVCCAVRGRVWINPSAKALLPDRRVFKRPLRCLGERISKVTHADEIRGGPP